MKGGVINSHNNNDIRKEKYWFPTFFHISNRHCMVMNSLCIEVALIRPASSVMFLMNNDAHVHTLHGGTQYCVCDVCNCNASARIASI